MDRLALIGAEANPGRWRHVAQGAIQRIQRSDWGRHERFVDATRIKLDDCVKRNQQARVEEAGKADAFAYELHIGTNNPYRAIETRHEDGWQTERKGVAYNLDTNELHAARFVKKKGWQIKPAPKAWAKLDGKPLDEICKLPLNSFHYGRARQRQGPPAWSTPCRCHRGSQRLLRRLPQGPGILPAFVA